MLGGAVLLKRTVGSIMVLKHNSVSNILPPPPQIFLPRWFRPPGVRPPPPTEGGRRYVEFPLTVTPDSDRSGEACCCEAFGTDTDESEAISICRTQRPMRRRLRFYFFGGGGSGVGLYKLCCKKVKRSWFSHMCRDSDPTTGLKSSTPGSNLTPLGRGHGQSNGVPRPVFLSSSVHLYCFSPQKKRTHTGNHGSPVPGFTEEPVKVVV